MKKLVFIAFALILTVALCACGSNAEWKYEESTHTLYVNSDSAMVPYAPNNDDAEMATATGAPWAEYLPEIESIVVGDSVTRISDYAFAYCSSLKNVTVGEKVSSLGLRCFYRCGDWGHNAEVAVTFNCATVPAFGEDVFGYTWDNPNVTLYVPADLLQKWGDANLGRDMKFAAISG